MIQYQVENSLTFLNHKAYNDVLDCNEPSLPHNPIYMKQYRYWSGIAGPRHFDPHFI